MFLPSIIGGSSFTFSISTPWRWRVCMGVTYYSGSINISGTVSITSNVSGVGQPAPIQLARMNLAFGAEVATSPTGIISSFFTTAVDNNQVPSYATGSPNFVSFSRFVILAPGRQFFPVLEFYPGLYNEVYAVPGYPVTSSFSGSYPFSFVVLGQT